MWSWILSALGVGASTKQAARKAQPTLTRGGAQTSLEVAFPGPLPGLLNLDAPDNSAQAAPLARAEDELFRRIERRIQSGRFELPQMPSTSRALADMVSNPSTNTERIVEAARVDPVLSGEILKLANSVAYAGRVPSETLQQAIMRVGRRPLRGMILALSMRGVIFMVDEFKPYAEEAFRQANSVANLARIIARHAGHEQERIFLVGLLHDIGKIALLHMLWKEVGPGISVTPELVTKLYLRYHEETGQAMAKAWKLSDEIISVTSCHHDFERNDAHPRTAALISLAHQMDLFLSTGNREGYDALMNSREASFLGLEGQTVELVMNECREAFVEQHSGAPAVSRAA